MNYEKDLEIDKNDLDNIFVKQPILAMKYQELLAKKQTERDDLKLELEVLEAEIDKEIRNKYTKKPPEVEIKNMVIMDKKRIAKIKEHNKIIEEYNILKGAVNSFEHRKKSLEKLTELYIAGYFSTVKQNTKENSIHNKQKSNLKRKK